MINTMKSIFTFAVVMVTSAGLLGCAAGMPSGVKNIETIVAQPTDNHPFTELRTRQSDNEVVLHGNIKHDHVYSEADAHVDVAIIDSSGKVLFRTSAQVSTDRVRGRYREAHFKVRLPEAPTKGTKVYVAFHSVRLNHGSKHECNDNQAEAMVSKQNGE